MTFRDSLTRLRRIWHIGAGMTIACFISAALCIAYFMRDGHIGGMYSLGEGHAHSFDPLKWSLWLLQVGADCCLLCAVIAIAAGVTYLIGKTLPDFTCLVSRP